jgi:hypothetical protein
MCGEPPAAAAATGRGRHPPKADLCAARRLAERLWMQSCESHHRGARILNEDQTNGHPVNGIVQPVGGRRRLRVSIAKDIITVPCGTPHRCRSAPSTPPSSPESMAAPKETTRSKPRTASRLLCGARLPTEPDSNCQMLQASSAPVIVSGGKCVMCAANNVPLPLQHEWLPPTRPARSAKSVELLEDFKTIGAFPLGPAGPTCTTAPAQPGQDHLPFAAQYE